MVVTCTDSFVGTGTAEKDKPPNANCVAVERSERFRNRLPVESIIVGVQGWINLAIDVAIQLDVMNSGIPVGKETGPNAKPGPDSRLVGLE
jgi:hypothetical protein